MTTVKITWEATDECFLADGEQHYIAQLRPTVHASLSYFAEEQFGSLHIACEETTLRTRCVYADTVEDAKAIAEYTAQRFI